MKQKATYTSRRHSLLLFILLFFLCLFSLLDNLYAAASPDELPASFDVSTDGYANLQEGSRLFKLRKYDEASAFLWRAVLLQEKAKENVSTRFVRRNFSIE